MPNIKTLSPHKELIQKLIERAFEEDIKQGDVTTNALIDEDTQADAFWQAKEKGIVAGLEVAKAVFLKLDPSFVWNPLVQDGDEVTSDDVLAKLHGSCRAILTGERTALNFVQRLAGIATQTHRVVEALKGTQAKLLDTRKTMPGMRVLDKYAVACGGGQNHRMGLFDMALIKDNHITAAGSITRAVENVNAHHPTIKVEVETKNLEEVNEALKMHVDMIMLDNMTPSLMKKAVALVNGQTKTEASGNITLKNIRKVADTGVDYISVGALTHSVTAFDISQLMKPI